jgi:hypothetical protein
MSKVSRREFIVGAAAVSVAATAFARSPLPMVVRHNILFIFADDMGWGDLSCYGPEDRTPNLEVQIRVRQLL